MGNRIYFSQGLRGSIAEQLQEGLFSAGFGFGNRQEFIDGDYGPITSIAMRQFRAHVDLPPVEGVDLEGWQFLTKEPFPSVFIRCLSLTASYEGHGFTRLEGNFDGAGLTFGIIGYTLKHGELKKLLATAFSRNPAVTTSFTPAQLQKWQEVMSFNIVDQVNWAGGLKKDELAAWRESFEKFGRDPAVQALQIEQAYQNYFVPALASAAQLGLRQELGIALSFDIHVQNGGFKDVVKQAVFGLSDHTEQQKREILANAVARSSKPEWQEDVRKRKITFVSGSGVVHGRSYDLSSWGLGEYLAS